MGRKGKRRKKGAELPGDQTGGGSGHGTSPTGVSEQFSPQKRSHDEEQEEGVLKDTGQTSAVALQRRKKIRSSEDTVEFKLKARPLGVFLEKFYSSPYNLTESVKIAEYILYIYSGKKSYKYPVWDSKLISTLKLCDPETSNVCKKHIVQEKLNNNENINFDISFCSGENIRECQDSTESGKTFIADLNKYIIETSRTKIKLKSLDVYTFKTMKMDKKQVVKIDTFLDLKNLISYIIQNAVETSTYNFLVGDIVIQMNAYDKEKRTTFYAFPFGSLKKIVKCIHVKSIYSYDRMNLKYPNKFSKMQKIWSLGYNDKLAKEFPNMNIDDAVAIVASIVSESVRNPSNFYMSSIIWSLATSWQDVRNLNPMLRGGSGGGNGGESGIESSMENGIESSIENGMENSDGGSSGRNGPEIMRKNIGINYNPPKKVIEISMNTLKQWVFKKHRY